jgi:hypothetical protein
MSEQSVSLLDIFDAAFDRPVVMHRTFAELTGSAAGGIFLSQAMYWSNRTDDPDGWFYKCQREWWEETALTRRELDSARAILVRLGILEEKVAGCPATTFYRLNKQILAEHSHYATERLRKKIKPKKEKSQPTRTNDPASLYVCSNCHEQMSKLDCTDEQTLTEITAETTSEITPEKKEDSNTTTGNKDFSGDEPLTPSGLILLYNELTPTKHPKVKKDSHGRLAKAKQYLQQWPEREFWEKVFGSVRHSAFLRGEKNSLGHEKFIGDFDWFLQRGKRDGVENCLKVYEGKYRDETNTDGMPRSTPSDLAQRFHANIQGGQRNV